MIDVIDVIINKRKEWLLNQNDGGKIYYDLVDNLINKSEIMELKNKKNETEEVLKSLIFDCMSETQLELYEKSTRYIEEYIESAIKTKKLKEKMKMVINNVSILNSELKLPIHDYLTIKYGIPIVVNEVDRESSDENEEQSSKIVNFYKLENFLENIELYKSNIEMISQKERYITNIMKNLKNELYLYLTNQKNFVNINKKVIIQSGKYFKRWILLTESEKMERFNSFCNYYVEKYMIQEGILSDYLKQETVDKLEKMVKDAFLSKKMVYRDYVWNANKGILEKIKILKYDREKKEFFLKYSKVNNQENNLQNKNKKKSSTRTVITKSNEKIINEEILYFIVKNANNVSASTSASKEHKESKEQCMEIIKKKLCIKKVSSDDKSFINKKYDEIYEVVINNKNDGNIGNLSNVSDTLRYQPML